ncbi:S8 family serine peptidase [Microbacterium fluvii]|uniref:S8 family serine peptidase n=1 Tax=Microbacterium fluvii TaxID=415215 RepID=A0ABW2HEK0_9MICO|nr:S8 family serine peptidase [Microbacterium fluvii]MCU4673316.1 S8 family serine peptidase [Microbacterium fluvii]
MARSILKKGARPFADVMPGEVVRRGRVITLSGEFGERDVHAVEVTGAGRADVTWTDGAIAIDTSGLAVGGHTLRLAGPSGRRAPGRGDLSIDIVVIDSPARVPDEFAVLHARRIRIGDLEVESLPMADGVEGDFRDVFKAVSRDGTSATTFAFDRSGEVVDLDAEWAALAERRLKRFGRVEQALAERLERGGEVEVAVWAATGDLDEELPPKSDRRAAGKPSREDLRTRRHIAALGEKLAEVAREHGLEVARVDQAAPVVYGRMPAEAVRALADDPLVAGVFTHHDDVVEDLGDSIAVHNSDDAHAAGFTGDGVRVAVYEDSPDVTTNLVISGQYTSSGSPSSHARMTTGIIRNSERGRPHGHAPDATVFSANSGDLDAIRWAAQDQGCTVISQSFHRTAEQTSSTLSHDDNYKDWLALHWPFPTIVEAAGNGTSTEFVNHKGYNRLTVGSHNDAASAMASSSVFRNPSSPHADRELPEIAANGMGVTVVGLTDSGTSFAAPAVAGIAACVQEAAPVLQSWPEGTRAVLMAGAWRNPSGGRWRADLIAGLDGSDGAGSVDADRSVRIAGSRQRRDNAGALRGFDVGTLRSADLDGSGVAAFRYRITTPRRPLFFGSHVKVALAWDSKATRTDILFLSIFQNALTVDLDLQVRDSAGRTVASSMSWDNSYEIAEFDASPGETYDIVIRRWSGTDDVWYGIAWTQIPTLFDIFGSVQAAPIFG